MPEAAGPQTASPARLSRDGPRESALTWRPACIPVRLRVMQCLSCGEENPDRARFCLACGSPLAEAAALAEERKVVSVLFVDLVGHTARSDQADPEDVRARLKPYHARA